MQPGRRQKSQGEGREQPPGGAKGSRSGRAGAWGACLGRPTHPGIRSRGEAPSHSWPPWGPPDQGRAGTAGGGAAWDSGHQIPGGATAFRSPHPGPHTHISPAGARPNGVHDRVHALAGVGGVWGGRLGREGLGWEGFSRQAHPPPPRPGCSTSRAGHDGCSRGPTSSWGSLHKEGDKRR